MEDEEIVSKSIIHYFKKEGIEKLALQLIKDNRELAIALEAEIRQYLMFYN